jgi:hypothetical protein
VDSTPLRLLADHLTRAQTALTDMTGDRSLCAVARSGESFPAAKYAEGSLSALVEIRRTARRENVAEDAAALLAVTDRVSAEWTERARRMPEPGRDWVAYLSGGRDALAALAEELADRTGS